MFSLSYGKVGEVSYFEQIGGRSHVLRLSLEIRLRNKYERNCLKVLSLPVYPPFHQSSDNDFTTKTVISEDLGVEKQILRLWY